MNEVKRWVVKNQSVYDELYRLTNNHQEYNQAVYDMDSLFNSANKNCYILHTKPRWADKQIEVVYFREDICEYKTVELDKNGVYKLPYKNVDSPQIIVEPVIKDNNKILLEKGVDNHHNILNNYPSDTIPQYNIKNDGLRYNFKADNKISQVQISGNNSTQIQSTTVIDNNTWISRFKTYLFGSN